MPIAGAHKGRPYGRRVAVVGRGDPRGRPGAAIVENELQRSPIASCIEQ